MVRRLPTRDVFPVEGLQEGMGYENTEATAKIYRTRRSSPSRRVDASRSRIPRGGRRSRTRRHERRFIG